jgi:hypothetical protein
MSARRLTSPPAPLASFARLASRAPLALLLATLALPACVVEPTEPDDVGAEVGEVGDDLEIGQPETPADDEATDPEQQLGEPQPTPWRATADGDGDPTPPDGCKVGVSGAGPAKDDE